MGRHGHSLSPVVHAGDSSHEGSVYVKRFFRPVYVLVVISYISHQVACDVADSIAVSCACLLS